MSSVVKRPLSAAYYARHVLRHRIYRLRGHVSSGSNQDLCARHSPLAHELYHVLMRTTGHWDDGIAKKSLPQTELVPDQLQFK